ncbi:MAG: alpha/beta hydrolase, partial [Chitinophagaceae bacterium]|nr:alpha/beta hydrolase [Chitinophagaceae bacterium]
FIVQAQYRVTLRISKLPSYHLNSETLYLAGTFNNWNPAQREYVFENNNGAYSLTLAVPSEKYEYKITRGSWDKVECADNGFPIANRTLEVRSDTTIEISINHWADHFPKQARKSTANKNVRILDTAFYMPQLNRYRRIWVYLPESYSASRKKYPVLYMHDGQNVFDEATSGFGEWGVDEAMDTLGVKYGEAIVVAIDHGGDKRINEYSPYDMPRFGKGEGDEYIDFLAKTLKRFIDKKYRTKKNAKHTYIAGSSIGGLISFYAILKYPKVFGGAGVFSPAFWIVPQLKDIISQKAKKVKGKIYFYGGKPESESMVPDMLAVFEKMHQYSKARMTTVIRADGKHNEATWRQEFPLFYKWMMGQ